MKKVLFLSLLFFVACVTIPDIGFPQATSTKSNDGQFGVINEQLPDLFTLTITSGGGSPEVGFAINLDITSFPGSASGQSLSVSSGVTDANGEVGFLFTLGDTVGVYIIAAAADSDTTFNTVTFTANAFKLIEVVSNLSSEIGGYSSENSKLINDHEVGISRDFTTKSGFRIQFKATPNASTKSTIRTVFKENLDRIIARAQRLKVLVP